MITPHTVLGFSVLILISLNSSYDIHLASIFYQKSEVVSGRLLNAMILVTKLQEAFEIQLDTSEINFENFQNLGTIVELIENKERSEAR